MLQTLRIRNLALLEEVELDFEAGFTAVTGETGAGKSILLGALGLLAGERVDKSVIRQGATACEVEASLYFSESGPIDALLRELDLPLCEEGVLLLKRSVPREKAPRISVNGSLATLGALQRLGERWVDFHGPTEPRRLLKDTCQLELLDLFGRMEPVLGRYGEAFGRWRELQAERKRLAAETRLPPDQVDYLRNQLTRLDALDLDAEAIATLERDFQRMQRAQELGELSQALAEGLGGDEGIGGRLASLLRQARELTALDPASAGLEERLTAAAVDLSDLAAEFGALQSGLQFAAEGAEDLTARMNAWLEMKRRYGDDPTAVAEARDELRHRLELQGDAEGTLARLDATIRAAEEKVLHLAGELRAGREKAAKSLARVASREIAELGFKRADFQIRIQPPGEPGPKGDGGCEFLFSPNVGEPPLPLARIASGGELARVMLALKTVLADLDDVPLLVFDEVDANVGGEVGRVVGRKLEEIAANHQVLCVTHLPQVAAQATCHLLVSKDQSGSRAVVRIEPIQATRKARVEELARMLGDRKASSALAHAEQLLGKEG